MTISELLSNLLELEINGHGSKRVYIESNSDIEESTITSIIEIMAQPTGVYIQI